MHKNRLAIVVPVYYNEENLPDTVVALFKLGVRYLMQSWPRSSWTMAPATIHSPCKRENCCGLTLVFSGE
jgi:hypothetical protein